jgi:hypothetical protein
MGNCATRSASIAILPGLAGRPLYILSTAAFRLRSDGGFCPSAHLAHSCGSTPCARLRLAAAGVGGSEEAAQRRSRDSLMRGRLPDDPAVHARYSSMRPSPSAAAGIPGILLADPLQEPPVLVSWRHLHVRGRGFLAALSAGR